jgi:hypothetical protein
MGSYLCTSVADLGSGPFLTPGSEIRDPGSEIGFFRILDVGSRIPNPYFDSLLTIFWAKCAVILCKVAQIFLSTSSKIKWLKNFVTFVATKKDMTKIFFHPSLLLLFLDPGSEIWDPGWIKIRIRDPQHCSVLVHLPTCCVIQEGK